jgi:hypothetical protein
MNAIIFFHLFTFPAPFHSNVDMPLLDEKNLTIDDIVVQWNESLLVNGIVVLLEGDLQVDNVIQDCVLFCEDKKSFRKKKRD